MVRNPNKTFWKNKKIFLTGHTGFKGSWLLLWLIELGAEVYGYSLQEEKDDQLFNQIFPKLSSKFINKYNNILDKELLNISIKEFSPDIVFHLAAQPLVRESYKDPLNTWNTNVIGTLNLLESLKNQSKDCSIIVITTDKVYKNFEWEYSYRENDQLGGYDPYSASKAASELAVSSWRNSFCGKEKYQNQYLQISTARAGNVIGGGDWAQDRIIPDAIRSLINSKVIEIRNPLAKRPWQHVLEPLLGYLLLAEDLHTTKKEDYTEFNFGPTIQSNQSVETLIDTVLKFWPGTVKKITPKLNYHEANLLNLNFDKAYKKLNWYPRWDFEETIERTVNWYKGVYEGENPYTACMKDIDKFLL
tara:strand:+ start:774 stop:1853 length:1080 start_codon:yes stop_codon:yes gene_type:complete